MQVLRGTPQSSLIGFKELVRQAADHITLRWLEAVRNDRSIPSAISLEEPLLSDAVPLVLDEILRVIEVDERKIEHEKICSAARHGRERAQEHFDVKELVREYQLLREQVFSYLEEHASQFARSITAGVPNINYRVGLALDEAMRETINAFVEEHIVQLRRLSRLDTVTGLYNHRIFYERFEDELNRAKRYDSPLTLVLIDLDNFKTVNDTRGHLFGDHMLVKCAEILRHELRQTDIISRYGGDEFGIILTETTRQHGHGMMVRLSNAIAELGIREGAPASFGMSFGLAAHPEDDGTVTRLVRIADDHLLYNKHMGKVGLAETRKGSL